MPPAEVWVAVPAALVVRREGPRRAVANSELGRFVNFII